MKNLIVILLSVIFFSSCHTVNVISQSEYDGATFYKVSHTRLNDSMSISRYFVDKNGVFKERVKSNKITMTPKEYHTYMK